MGAHNGTTHFLYKSFRSQARINEFQEMRSQKTVLVTTHDIEEADTISDRIAVIHEGRIKAFGTPMYLKNQQGFKSRVNCEKYCPTRHYDYRARFHGSHFID